MMNKLDENEDIMKNEGIPGYLRVKQDISAGVRNNRWGAGGRIPKESELAKLYNISRATVARGINELVNEGLLLRIKGTGTFKREDIHTGEEKNRLPPSGATCIVILCNNIQELTKYPIKTVIDGMQDEAGKHARVSLQTFSVNHFSILREENKAVFNLITAGAAKGLITMSKFAMADFEYFSRQGIPTVRLNSQMLEEGVYTVSTDFFAGAYEVVRHLTSLGHRKIGLVGGKGSGWGSSQDMSIRGYRFAMEQLNLAQEEKIILLPLINEGEEENVVRSYLSEFLQCSALYVTGDAVAFWLAKVLKGERRIALVGCGNYLKDRMEKVTISSLDWNNQEVGRRAVELLLRVIKGEDIGTPSILIKPELVVRESSTEGVT